MPYKVLVVDDHGVLRAGLLAMLAAEPGLEMVGEAGSAEEAVRICDTEKPDIILMDISLGQQSGIDVTRRIKMVHPRGRVLILTVHEEKELLQEAIRAGASGYILKRAVKSELISAIYSVMRGDLYIYPGMTRALLTNAGIADQAGQPQPDEPLSGRELEVMRLIAHGNTNQQVADLLHISVRTVEFHRANIMDKLNLKSRVGLVRYAVEHGLMDGGDSQTS